jgi:hypothetical protein
VRSLVAQIKKHPAVYALLRQGIYARLQSARRKQIFLRAYQDNLWGAASSLSGPGSDLRATQDLRAQLPELLKALEATSMLDAPCGDLAWMKQVPLGELSYIGADIVAPMIERHRRELADFGEFLCLDLLSGGLPRADVVFCRDCLVHFSNREIQLAVRNIKASGATYLLTTTFPDVAQNIDTVTPYWRAINLQAPPFDFPAPLRLIRDYSDEQVNDQGKHLAVWRCSDLLVRV